jgi:hypothetical protein
VTEKTFSHANDAVNHSTKQIQEATPNTVSPAYRLRIMSIKEIVIRTLRE